MLKRRDPRKILLGIWIVCEKMRRDVHTSTQWMEKYRLDFSTLPSSHVGQMSIPLSHIYSWEFTLLHNYLIIGSCVVMGIIYEIISQSTSNHDYFLTKPKTQELTSRNGIKDNRWGVGKPKREKDFGLVFTGDFPFSCSSFTQILTWILSILLIDVNAFLRILRQFWKKTKLSREYSWKMTHIWCSIEN